MDSFHQVNTSDHYPSRCNGSDGKTCPIKVERPTKAIADALNLMGTMFRASIDKS